MAFILLRIFYAVYFLGSALIFYNLVSQLMFKGETVDLAKATNHILFVLVWPLALCSRPGRKKLFKLVRRL